MQTDQLIILTRDGTFIGLTDNPSAAQRWLEKCEEDAAYGGFISSRCKAEPWTISHTYEEILAAPDRHEAEKEARRVQAMLDSLSPEVRAIMNARERPQS